jgi:hypothetical protein
MAASGEVFSEYKISAHCGRGCTQLEIAIVWGLVSPIVPSLSVTIATGLVARTILGSSGLCLTSGLTPALTPALSDLSCFFFQQLSGASSSQGDVHEWASTHHGIPASAMPLPLSRKYSAKGGQAKK